MVVQAIIKKDFVQPIQIDIRLHKEFNVKEVPVSISSEIFNGKRVQRIMHIEGGGFLSNQNIVKPRVIPETGQARVTDV